MHECEHQLAGGVEDLLTFCTRCGHWYAVYVTDDGSKAWQPFNRAPVEAGALHHA